MFVEVDMRSGARRELVEDSIKFFIKELKLERSRYNLSVITEPGLRRAHDSNGLVFVVEEKEIAMILDSRLSLPELLATISHEMVHVKQIAKGTLRTVLRRGQPAQTWLGRTYNVAYHLRPWELEAFRKERELAHKYFYQLSRKCK